ncbi:hypothetical protein [Thermodesulfobacterium hydrogeniphilum]|uniref:hypothetical protein n=1 Tax=Thermodesulfobacterium hydrogeniphilum TaxID=161156 RepID=UPI0005700FFB|nr:hypothetical protein [Thermodesulfobacterium hydrogeniphilum]
MPAVVTLGVIPLVPAVVTLHGHEMAGKTTLLFDLLFSIQNQEPIFKIFNPTFYPKAFYLSTDITEVELFWRLHFQFDCALNQENRAVFLGIDTKEFSFSGWLQNMGFHGFREYLKTLGIRLLIVDGVSQFLEKLDLYRLAGTYSEQKDIHKRDEALVTFLIKELCEPLDLLLILASHTVKGSKFPKEEKLSPDILSQLCKDRLYSFAPIRVLVYRNEEHTNLACFSRYSNSVVLFKLLVEEDGRLRALQNDEILETELKFANELKEALLKCGGRATYKDLAKAMKTQESTLRVKFKRYNPFKYLPLTVAQDGKKKLFILKQESPLKPTNNQAFRELFHPFQSVSTDNETENSSSSVSSVSTCYTSNETVENEINSGIEATVSNFWEMSKREFNKLPEVLQLQFLVDWIKSCQAKGKLSEKLSPSLLFSKPNLNDPKTARSFFGNYLGFLLYAAKKFGLSELQDEIKTLWRDIKETYPLN